MAQEIDERDLLVDDIVSIDPEDDPQRPPPGLWDDEEPPFPTDDPEDMVERGGPGSGHFGHEGRPGQVGGSLPGDGQPEDFHSAARRKELYGGIELVGAMPDDVVDGVKRAIDKIPLHLRPAVRMVIWKRNWDRISHPPGSKEVWLGADNYMLDSRDGEADALDGKRIFTQAQLDYEKKQEAKGNHSWHDPKRVMVESIRAHQAELALPHEIGHAVQDVLPERLADRTWRMLKRYGKKIRTQSTAAYEDYYFGPESFYSGADLPEQMVQRRFMREQYAEGFRLWVAKDPQFRKLPADLRKIYTDLNRTELETEWMAVLRGGPGSGHFGHKGRPGEVGGSDAGDFHPGKGKKVSKGTKDTSAPEFKPAGTKAVKAPISIAPKLVIGEQDDKPEPVEQFDDGSAIVGGRRSWLSEQEIAKAKRETGVGPNGEILSVGSDQEYMDDKILRATVATDQNMNADDWKRWDALRQAMDEKYEAIVDDVQAKPSGKALDAIRPQFDRAVQTLQEANDALEEELAKPSPDPDVLHDRRRAVARIVETASYGFDAMDAYAEDMDSMTEALADAGTPMFDGDIQGVPGDDERLRLRAANGGYAGYAKAAESVAIAKAVLARFTNPELLKAVGPFSVQPPEPLQGMGFSRSHNYMSIEADATPAQVIHEYGHALSDSNPKVGDLAKMFLLYRTQGDGSLPYRGDVNIQVKPDGFISEYAGRFYALDKGAPVSGEEVFSMGLQLLATNASEFAKRDPEHMAFTLALLAGDWEKAEAVARGLSFSPLVRRLLPAAAQQTWLDAAQRLAQAFGMAPDAEKPAPPGKPVPAPQEGTVDLLRLPTTLHGSGIWGTAYTTEEASRLAQDVMARQTPEVREALAKAEADLTNREISKHDRDMDADERKRARKRIERQMLRYGQKEDQPEAVLLAGLPGSGKTTLLNSRAHEFRNYVRLSADDIRSRMPRYEGWNSPLLAEEADDVLERVMMQAVKEKRPLVLDSMLKTGDTAERIVKALGAHGYRTRVIFVDTPMEQAMERAIKRYTSGTGRYVSPAYIASHADKGLHTFERLKSAADAWEHWTNDGDAPKKVGEGKRNA